MKVYWQQYVGKREVMVLRSRNLPRGGCLALSMAAAGTERAYGAVPRGMDVSQL